MEKDLEMAAKRETYKSRAALYGIFSILLLLVTALNLTDFVIVILLVVTVIFSLLTGAMLGCAVTSGEFNNNE